MKAGFTMDHLAKLFLLCLGIAGYSSSYADISMPDEVYRAATAADGVQHVRIEGGSYFFKPSHVVVHVNVPVELTVSVGSSLIPHTLVIHAPDAGISVDQSLSGNAQSIRFTPTAGGKYSFYCRNKLLFFTSHREKGMEGVLEVAQ